MVAGRGRCAGDHLADEADGEGAHSTIESVRLVLANCPALLSRLLSAGGISILSSYPRGGFLCRTFDRSLLRYPQRLIPYLAHFLCRHFSLASRFLYDTIDDTVDAFYPRAECCPCLRLAQGHAQLLADATQVGRTLRCPQRRSPSLHGRVLPSEALLRLLAKPPRCGE